MDRHLISLCLSCVVIGQAVGWGYFEPRLPVPTKVVVQQAAPVAAHGHRYTGSLLLSKAKAFIKSDDVSYNKGYGYAAPAYGYAAPAYSYGNTALAYPNKFLNALTGYKYAAAAPLYVPPFAPAPADAGYLKWKLYDELNRKNEEYRKFKAGEAERERRQFQKYKEAKEEKEEQFEVFLQRQAEAEEDRQKLREFRRYSQVNDYLQKREQKAEFGALIGQVDEKRREYVFNMVFRVMRFCKCRDAIVDLHRYFSGNDRSSKFQNQKDERQNFGDDDTQLFGEGGVIPIPRSAEEARRWFMRGLVNTICDSSKFYVEKVKRLAAQQGFSATFDAQFSQLGNNQDQNQDQGQDQGQGREFQQDYNNNYGSQDNRYATSNY